MQIVNIVFAFLQTVLEVVMYTIGERLKHLRTLSNMKQSDIAEKIGISTSNISRIEKDEISPSATIVLQICKSFNVSTDWLLTGSDVSSKLNSNQSDDTETATKEKTLSQLIMSNFKALSSSGQETLANQSAIILEKERVYQQELAKTRKLTYIKKAVPKENEPSVEPVIVEMLVFDQAASAGLGNYLYGDSSYNKINFNEDDIPGGANYGIRISGDSMEPEIYHGDIVWVEERLQIEDGQIGIFILNEESYCKKLKIDRDNNAVYLISLNPNYAPIKVSRSDSLRTVGRVLL